MRIVTGGMGGSTAGLILDGLAPAPIVAPASSLVARGLGFTPKLVTRGLGNSSGPVRHTVFRSTGTVAGVAGWRSSGTGV